MSKRVVVFDYGFGNVRSAERAVAHVGADVEITSDFDAAMDADGLLVPGVGAFAACMRGLTEARGDWIVGRRLSGGRPVLGICVGMQVLFEHGDEHGVVTKGLGLLPGGVTKLPAERLPHMGWNTVHAPEGSVLFAGLPADSRFYFVHSYAVNDLAGLAAAGAKVTTAHHGTDFVAAVERGTLSAAQFHPEKSADTGAALLRNWLAAL